MTQRNRAATAIIDLVDEMHRLRGRFATAFADARERSGLSALEHTVISAVVNAAQPPTVPQIGRSLGHPRQVIQRAADVLARQGLIEMIDNPDHKRARRLVATPAGRGIHETADLSASDWAEDFARDFDVERLEATVSTLREVRLRLQRPDSGRTREDRT